MTITQDEIRQGLAGHKVQVHSAPSSLTACEVANASQAVP